MSNQNFLFVEKYRPQTIDECVLSDSMKDTFKEFVSKGQIPHMLFSGTAGTGKTTLARAVCRELGADLMYINASNESGIDTIRNKVIGFASVASFEGNLKVIILDECLSENESVRVGTVDSWQAIPLKSLKRDTEYPIVSFNENTRLFENDTGAIISDREDELFEVTLSNGKKIVANSKHPFMCIDSDGNVVQRTIEDGFAGVEVITTDYPIGVASIVPVGKGRVMNLTVFKNHTFVTENGIVTHNCDHVTAPAQAALRATMEEFSATTRFILTCNFKNRIIDPLISRCSVFEFRPNETEKKDLTAKALRRVVEVMKKEEIEFELPTAIALVKQFYPDMRKILNEVQRSSSSGKLDADCLANNTSYDSLNNAMRTKKYMDVRKWVAQNPDLDANELFRYYYDNLTDLFEPKSIPQIVLMLAQYQHYAVSVVDQEINIMACLTEIMSAASWK